MLSVYSPEVEDWYFPSINSWYSCIDLLPYYDDCGQDDGVSKRLSDALGCGSGLASFPLCRLSLKLLDSADKIKCFQPHSMLVALLCFNPIVVFVGQGFFCPGLCFAAQPDTEVGHGGTQAALPGAICIGCLPEF